MPKYCKQYVENPFLHSITFEKISIIFFILNKFLFNPSIFLL